MTGINKEKNTNVDKKYDNKYMSFKYFIYIITSIFIFAAIGLFDVSKAFTNPQKTTFATIDYLSGDSANLNPNNAGRFGKTFHDYRMRETNGREIMIRKIKHTGSEGEKAVYCIDRTTEFPDERSMDYKYNGTLTKDSLVIPQYTYVKGEKKVVEHTISGNKLGQLRWLVDQFYIRETKSSIDVKQAIKKNLYESAAAYHLRKGGSNPSYEKIKKESKNYYDKLNDSDLESLQQWVLWDIANEGIDKTKYDPYNGGTLYYTLRTEAGKEDLQKYKDYRVKVYEYLYNTAKTKNKSYNNEVKTPQIEGRVKSEQVSTSETGLSQTGIINYGYKIAIPGDSENKSAITKIDLYDGGGNLISPSEYIVGLYSGEKPTPKDRKDADSLKLTLQDVVGEGDFFIYFKNGNKYFDKSEKFVLKAKSRNIVTYPYVYLPDGKYINEKDGITQAVVMLDRDEQELEQQVEVEAPKGFDLALRKSIIKVTTPETGEVRTFEERKPKVDSSNLKPTSKGATDGQKTAKYMHPKNPIDVLHGDIITYEFNIYNEDDQDKILKQIKDRLPKNLKMVPTNISKINEKYGWEADSQGKILTANLKEVVNLKGVTPNGNGSTINGNYKIYLEAYVLDTAEEGEILTNISEISVDQPDKDRDSTPDNHFKTYFSSMSEEKLKNYKGNDLNKSELGDKNYFYKGQQDDDDFEKVRVVVPKSDLSLKKFVNRVNSKPLKIKREPVVDVSPLKSGKTDAKYTFGDKKENKVMIKKGDLVEYIIRVYNEGEIDAYASEVEDRLPQGTEFVPEDETNKAFGWKVDPSNPKNIKTNILSKESETNENGNLLKRFNPKTDNSLDYKDLKVVVRVVDASDPAKLINISEITKQTNKKGKPTEDRDSTPNNKDPKEDDQDYENLIGAEFDLALRKFITNIDEKKVEISREPVVDVTPLKTKTGTTANYSHPKNPLEVEKKSIVRYTIRVYNEGNIDGYAKEVTDNLPDALRFLEDSEINKKYGWKVDPANPKKIRTNYLSKEEGEKNGRDNLLKAYNENNNSLDYRDLEIEVRVNVKDKEIENNTNTNKNNNTNDTENKDKNKKDKNNISNFFNASEITDNNVEVSAKKNNFNSSLIENEEFMTEIIGDTKTYKVVEEGKEQEKEQEQNKILNNKETSEKTLTPVDGEKLKKENEQNKEQNTKVETTSKENLEIVKLENENMLRNIAEITEDEDEFGNEIEDRDSDPKRKTYERNPEGSWEDDEDFEKLKLKEKPKPKIFDLALIKLITSYELTDGTNSVTKETGHTRETNNPEPVVKIDLNQFKIENTQIKYNYTIEITNEGELEGFATEITDYIPHGLKFFKEDNPDWYEKGNGMVGTRKLENTLLKPGQSAQVTITLRWDKEAKYFGQMTNVAEISEDKNEFGTPDIDSVPNNKKPNEDDIDDATVLLSIETGAPQTFYAVVISSLTLIGVSALGIKKSMLNPGGLNGSMYL